MRFLVLLVLYLSAVVVTVDALEEHFGSKSAYPYSSSLSSSSSSIHHFTSLFILTRHGSRFPTKKHLVQYDQLKQDFPAMLANWTHAFAVRDEGLLSPAGKQEMRQLGALTRQLYPSLFTAKYHPRTYELRSSRVTRTLQSASAFASGLFGGDGDDEPMAIESESPSSDLLLRFHENCDQYQTDKKQKTPNVMGILAPVLHKLHTKYSTLTSPSTAKQVLALWSACTFQGTLTASSACQFFDKEDAELLEFANDVGDYWEKSFGSEINYAMACQLVDHMLDSVQQPGKVRMLFGHAENVMPLMAALGFFHETADKYHPGAPDWRQRKWRSGVVSPFAANVFVATYERDKELYVQVRHNGQVMDLSHLCQEHASSSDGGGECTWQEFKDALRARLGTCDFDKLCKKTTRAVGGGKGESM